MREQIRDDGGIWWTHLCVRMLQHEDTNSLHQETPRGRGEVGCSLCHIPVAWLQRGVDSKNDFYNH